MKDNSILKYNILTLEDYCVKEMYFYCVKNYKNIIKGNIYFVKKIGRKRNNAYYLIKGRWLHSSYIKKLTDKEIISYKRKLKIKNLLK